MNYAKHNELIVDLQDLSQHRLDWTINIRQLGALAVRKTQNNCTARNH